MEIFYDYYYFQKFGSMYIWRNQIINVGEIVIFILVDNLITYHVTVDDNIIH
jgi:hypothetical protein